jgi:hypothetical protein
LIFGQFAAPEIKSLVAISEHSHDAKSDHVLFWQHVQDADFARKTEAKQRLGFVAHGIELVALQLLCCVALT